MARHKEKQLTQSSVTRSGERTRAQAEMDAAGDAGTKGYACSLHLTIAISYVTE